MFPTIKDKGHDYLRRLSFSKAKDLYGDPLPNEVSDRLNFELHIIEQREASDLFLFLHEVVTVAQTILDVHVGPGRGTAAGSIVNYCLGITRIDPLKYDLLFERFIDPAGRAAPYIALDFDSEGGESVLYWIQQEYGNESYPRSGEFDFLEMEALSVLKDTIQKIKECKGESVDIERIPMDDTKTFELFQNGMTDDIFQFEEEDIRNLLIDFHPMCFEDLMALNSLYRSGSIDKISTVIQWKNSKAPIGYDVPELEKYLHNTYGVIVYQEQIMLISRLVSNFTVIESDLLRRVVVKKRIDLIPTLKAQFMEGGLQNGHSEQSLEKIWDAIKGNATFFAFNKSHAVCYTWIAYQIAYLKANYPGEFKEVIEKYSFE